MRNEAMRNDAMRQGDAMNNIDTLEMISALADSQLHGDDFSRAVEVATSDKAALGRWQTYHLIGDVLRSGDLAASSESIDFMKRFQQRMAREPVSVAAVLATAVFPAESTRVDTQPVAAGDPVSVQQAAANDSSFRWKLVAGCASLAAVAAIGWTALGGLGSLGGLTGQPGQGQLAASPAQGGTTVTATGERGVMVRDARLDELLDAHRQFGGASALQMPAGFLRNATFEGPVR